MILRAIAFLVAYPIAVMVIVRWVPVVRERRWRWFLEHQVAVAVIVIGHATAGRASAVVINGTWFVVAAIWYSLGGRRKAARTTPSAGAG